jgi:hypothetical protein
MVQIIPGKIMRPYLEKLRTNRAGYVTQVTEFLPSNCEALSQIPVQQKRSQIILLNECNLQGTVYHF